MPTYDYKCDACGHSFELFQKMSDPPAESCPKCGGKVRRLIGAGAGVLFKGSGFYATDYRSPDYKAKAKSEGGGGGAAPTPEGGTSPTPPAEKKDPKPPAAGDGKG